MKSSSVTKFSLTLMATVAVIGIATTASTKAQDGEVSPEVIAEVERLIMNMRQSRFDRHSCGSAPRFPSSYDNDTLSRLASRSNQWYSCMADHVSDLQYEAENAGYNLEAALLDVPNNHSIWPRVARTIAFYNERATRSLESAQDKYSTQQARAQTFVDNVNSARQKQESWARLQYSIECVGEQTMAATLYNPYSTGYGYNPYGYNSYRTYGTYGYNSPSLSILDSDGCVERKMAGIQTSPYDYYPSYYYTPNYYYVPQDQVTINVDTHVDVTVVTNDY